MCIIDGYQIAVVILALFGSLAGVFIAFDWANNKWPRLEQEEEE